MDRIRTQAVGITAAFLLSGVSTAQFFGHGCGATQPTVDIGLPQPGSELRLSVGRMRPGMPMALFLGGSRLSTPLSLAPFGTAPECELLVRPDASIGGIADSAGAFTRHLYVPDTALVGSEFVLQAIALDLDAGPVGTTVSTGTYAFIAAAVWNPFTNPTRGSIRLECDYAETTLYRNTSTDEQLVSYYVTSDCPFGGGLWVPGTSFLRRVTAYDHTFGSVQLAPGESLTVMCSSVRSIDGTGCKASYGVLAWR